MSCLGEGREDLVLWVIDENIAVSKIKDARAAVLAGTVPSGIGELPANLKCNNRLAGSRRKCEEHTFFALQYCLHGAVYGYLLVVTR